MKWRAILNKSKSPKILTFQRHIMPFVKKIVKCQYLSFEPNAISGGQNKVLSGIVGSASFH